MKISFILILLPLILFSITLKAQNEQFTIVFYNVENLFDTIYNEKINDLEFTPRGNKKWNTERYNKKLHDVSKVLAAVNPLNLPEIIGLAEIENLSVLEDLIKTPPISKGNYGIVHVDSPDPRGIDVALLYRKDRFRYSSHRSINIPFPFDTTLRTRDILHVNGIAPDGKEINFFVNHWSSRSGGERQTEAMRMHSAVALRRNIDIILSKDARSRILIMGDMNDEPTNQSLRNVLQASNKRRNVLPSDLYNLHYDLHNFEREGSYNFRGNWNMLDQIIVSYNLINQEAYYSCDFTSGKIFKEDWMLVNENDSIYIPHRGYNGNEYLGGASDHLPVYVILTR